ncbi:hypothetical protein CPLU01_04917 [Colletotrichum plurivorum]|uniref:Uncharacterized protein n=1 Tax=Colletotrichum plurivorum TaxID=2175906 RepID=A0A8H6NI45_9PEZI|nr:hypothetical protein CPLU01_04917 [Colletotrichum plurivorum]
MATKKTMGKRQRDRLKKAQAKREATTAAAAANPTYSQATSFNTRPSSGPTTSRVQELDPGTYNNVKFLTNSMGMGDCVAESVTVDHKGRRLRVMMGTESIMDLLSQRLHNEKKFQSRLDRITELYNGLFDDIILIENTHPGAAAQPLFKFREINTNLYAMLSRSDGNIENDYYHSQGPTAFQGYPSQIKLVLARGYEHYNFARLQSNSGLGQQINEIEQGLKSLHDALVMENQDCPMDDIF